MKPKEAQAASAQQVSSNLGVIIVYLCTISQKNSKYNAYLCNKTVDFMYK